MELRITCQGSDVIDYKKISNLQDNLKTRTMDDIDGMIKSLIQHGFSFPMFVYKHKDTNYAIDGHGRLIALSLMEETGYCLNQDGELEINGEPWTIPSIPCIYVEAKNLEDAKVKLLKLNSEYGTITQTGFADFTKDLAIGEYSGIPLRIAETDAIADVDPLSNISSLIPTEIDLGAASTVAPGAEAGEPEKTDFEPSLEPQIDTSAVTHEDIERASEKEHDRKPLDIETMHLTCKHCGKTLSIRKSDINLAINKKIKELSNARN